MTGNTAERDEQEANAAQSGDAKQARWFVTLPLGLIMFGVAALLLVVLFLLWPTFESAPEADPAKKLGPERVLGVSITLTPGSALLLLVILTSALGAFVHSATSFSTYVGNRRMVTSWTWWYILRLPVGVALAIIFYFALRAGLLGSDGTAASINPYGLAAISAMAGLFSKQAVDKLREVFEALFRTAKGLGDDERTDKATNPRPLISAVDPPGVRAGSPEVRLTLIGEGFLKESVVEVIPPGGDPSRYQSRPTEFRSPTKLRVSLVPEDVAQPGVLLVTVVNPGTPGRSDPVRVAIV
jgi:hypothetical protein